LKIDNFKPDLIHAHYGLSGLFANLQRKIPVITTFHGSDINLPKNRIFSKIALYLSRHSIFVSNNLKISIGSNKGFVIPCGVDIDIFKPQSKKYARKALGLELNSKLVLFSSSFDRQVKNPNLAIKAVSALPGVKLIELIGYSRVEVSLLMNAVDVCLSTSFSEGSPQFIKEALCCDAIVLSTKVGDLGEYTSNLSGFFFTDYNIESTKDILESLLFSKKSFPWIPNNRSTIRELFDNRRIAMSINDIYKTAII
jgi:glycosyltransferase involved in cell wall biosynthesis